MPASLIGSEVWQVKFDCQTALQLFHQEGNGTIPVHLDLVIFSPFVLRSPDGTVYNLDPQTSRAALAPVIDLLGGTITGVTVDGNDTVEHDGNGNPVTALGTLTVDFADGAQLTVPAAAPASPRDRQKPRAIKGTRYCRSRRRLCALRSIGAGFVLSACHGTVPS